MMNSLHENSLLILNEFEQEDDITNWLFDVDHRTILTPYSIVNENGKIELDTLFGLSSLLDRKENVSVLLCQKQSDNKSKAVAYLENATLFKNPINLNWIYYENNISCDAEKSYIIPVDKQIEIYIRSNYIVENKSKFKKYINEIAITKNCVYFDTYKIDKMVSNATNYSELFDASCKYSDNHQYKINLELWKKEYRKNPTDTDVIYQLAQSYMDCDIMEEARKLYLKIFDDMGDDDYYLSKLAIAYFRDHYNSEARDIAKLITDRSFLKEWNFSYEYIMSTAPAETNYFTVNGKSITRHMVNIEFDKMPLPKIINNDSGKKFVDPVKGKGISVTPEERIRQKVIRYLLDVCKIPKENIISEDHMVHYDKNSTTRADITVRHNDKTILIVECKAPYISIDGAPIEQLFGYNAIMKSKFLLLTNGTESYIFHQNRDDYEAILKLPSFNEMLMEEDMQYSHFEKNAVKRPSLSEMNSTEIIRQYKDDGMYIGPNTPDKFVPIILNLMWAFLDTSHVLPSVSGYGVTVIEDCGTIRDTVSNISGGSYPGTYRKFHVKDRKGKECFVSFAVLGTYKKSDTAGGYTSLICGVDRNSNSISRLQLNLNNSITENLLSYTLCHNGARSRKSNKSTIDYVNNIRKELIRKNQVFLGEFSRHKLIDLSENNAQDFILRLISYVLIRDEI